VPTLLCEVRLCTALTSCLIFLTSTIMHFGLRAGLQTSPLCDLPHNMTKRWTDLLCGCNTQLSHSSHSKVTSVLQALACQFRTQTAPIPTSTSQHTWCWLSPTVQDRHKIDICLFPEQSDIAAAAYIVTHIVMPEMPLCIEAHSYLENRLEPAKTASNDAASG